jgi:hypothetical protein
VARLALALLALALAAPARAQLGIDLSEPPPKKQKEERPREAPPPPAPGAKPAPAPAPEAKPAPAPEAKPAPAPAPPRPTSGPIAERLAAADALLRRDAEAAALAHDAILRDPAAADGHADARLGLAEALAALRLDRSAIAVYGDVLALGPGSPRFDRAANALFELSSRTGDEGAVLAQVGRLEGAPLGGAAEDRLHYLLARHGYERALALEEAGRAEEARRGYAEARREAALVKGGGSGARGDVHARARFVDGLAAYAQGAPQEAVNAFQEVVRATNPRRTGDADARLRELALLQLARIHYEHGQNRYALFYYGRMPQAGASWLDGLWESSYAYYRIGDSERALGNLLTLHSPYFEEEWYPESHLLKAIIYYENCRYPEARAILDEFQRRFEPVHAALARVTGRDEPPEAFLATALAGGAEGDRALARRLTRLALADGHVRRLSEAVREVEREAREGLARRGDAFRGSQLSRDLRARLDAERARLAAEGGARARHQLAREQRELREILEQALRVKIEVSRREREALEAAITKQGGGPAVRDYRYSAAVSDEHLYWPYDGEFWRDELGTYAYTLTKGCRDSPGGAQATR